jgi:putative transposase
VARKCVVIAHAVHETGRREIIGLDVGAGETEAFWREFLRIARARSLLGVELALSDAHPGLKAALAQVLGAPWQRCTVHHFLRDLRGHVRRDQHDALGAIIRQIFTAPDAEQARQRLRDAVGQLERRLPKIAALLDEAEPDVLAVFGFPTEHWPKLRSTNPLERFNREIARRTDGVGIFPDDASLIRLVSMLAIEANDEWLVGRSYISQKRWPLSATRWPRRISLEIKTRRSSSSLPNASVKRLWRGVARRGSGFAASRGGRRRGGGRARGWLGGGSSSRRVCGGSRPCCRGG